MSKSDIGWQLNDWKQLVEHSLAPYVEQLNAPITIKESMLYSLQAGGKRIRPMLVFATLQAFAKDAKVGIPVACAIEMIHTYSLIHDDLPSMDNDDLRRGKPTNHKVFGEAMAILAGDGLLTYAFEILANDSSVTPETRVKLIAGLARAAGPEGMVAGQVADMEGEGQQLPLEQLEYIHMNKTGRMLTFSVEAGAILAGASETEIHALRSYAYHLGLAFQIRDDILDIEGVVETIGKPVGSDLENNKSTYPALLSMEGAKKKLKFHIDEAQAVLETLGFNIGVLHFLADLVANRES